MRRPPGKPGLSVLTDTENDTDARSALNQTVSSLFATVAGSPPDGGCFSLAAPSSRTARIDLVSDRASLRFPYSLERR